MKRQGAWPLAPERLEEHFSDKRPLWTRGEAVAEALRCLHCHDAPCTAACPTSIDIPTFIRKVATDNRRGSARTILAANLLATSCSTACPVEELCEGACVYTAWGRKPIEIGQLQRYAVQHQLDRDLLPRREQTGKSVGLVGGGPASLACAGRLALLGHAPVIYERAELPGGLNVTGVAPYKLNVEAALVEAEFIRELGVQIKTGIEVGRDISPEELLSRHEAVFLGLGLGNDSMRGVPGASGPGVLGALQWIRRMKLGAGTSVSDIEHGVVVGGGNTALDVAQELAGLGVPHVALVYRRLEQDMPGYDHEWEGCKRARVRLIERASVAAVRRDEQEKLCAITLTDSSNGHDKGELPCDLLVVATGQQDQREIAQCFPGVCCDDRGRILADPETLVTGNPRIFTGGDCYNGGKEVVNAADEGQRAASAIDALLRSSEKPCPT